MTVESFLAAVVSRLAEEVPIGKQVKGWTLASKLRLPNGMIGAITWERSDETVSAVVGVPFSIVVGAPPECYVSAVLRNNRRGFLDCWRLEIAKSEDLSATLNNAWKKIKDAETNAA